MLVRNWLPKRVWFTCLIGLALLISLELLTNQKDLADEPSKRMEPSQEMPIESLLLKRGYILQVYGRDEILRVHILRKRLCKYSLEIFLSIGGM